MSGPICTRPLPRRREAEGFTALAHKFRMVAEIEKTHEERYLKLLENVEMKKVFEKSEEVMWVCRNCGHIVIGKKGPGSLSGLRPSPELL